MFAQFSSVQFSAANAACWATPSFYASQPLVLTVDIPSNATNVEITTTAGNGNLGFYHLRECAYNSCTTFQYYNAVCPIITSLGFGKSNITGLLSPGSHFLTLDSLDGTASTEITSAVVNVSIPIFSFSTSEKSCVFNKDKTHCTTNITVKGNGTCFYPVQENFSVSIQGTAIEFNITESKAQWSCSSGNYSIGFLLEPISVNQTWKFLNSDLSNQLILSTLELNNPSSENLLFPFDFGSDFSIFGESRTGVVELASNESKNITIVFSANVINYSVDFSPVNYNFSATEMIVNANVLNSFSIPFFFSTSDFIKEEFECQEQNFSVVSSLNFSLRCSPPVAHVFNNWSFINSTALKVMLYINGTENLPVIVSNTSQFFSQLFSTSVSMSAENFQFSSPIELILSGDFVVVSSEKTQHSDVDLFNYSIYLRNPTNETLNATLGLDFSQYTQVSFPDAVIPLCPEIVCVENSTDSPITVFVNVFNQTNFSIAATRKIELPITVSSTSSSSSPSAVVSNSPELAFPLVFLNNSINQTDDSEINVEETQKTLKVGKDFNLDSLNVQKKLEQKESQTPAVVSGFAPFFSPFFLLPLAFLSFLPFLAFVLKKGKVVERKHIGKSTEITLVNTANFSFCGILLREVLPIDASVDAKCKKFKSVIGTVLEWKKLELKPGEKWSVSYSSSLPRAKGRVSFTCNGKKQELFF